MNKAIINKIGEYQESKDKNLGKLSKLCREFRVM